MATYHANPPPWLGSGHAQNRYAPQQRPQLAPSWPEILDVSPLADRAAIKAAFRRKAQQFHPDHGGTDYQMRLIIGAYKEALRARRA